MRIFRIALKAMKKGSNLEISILKTNPEPAAPVLWTTIGETFVLMSPTR